jgi:CBS domain-containing protein
MNNPEASSYEKPASPTAQSFLRSLFEKNVITIPVEAKLSQVANLMRENHIGDVVVVEKREGLTVPMGILTDRDLVLAALTQTFDPNVVSAGDILPRALLLAHDTDDLVHVIRIMRDEGVARLPVVDAQGQLVGIITAKNLLEGLIQELDELVHISENRREREKEAIRH